MPRPKHSVCGVTLALVPGNVSPLPPVLEDDSQVDKAQRKKRGSPYDLCCLVSISARGAVIEEYAAEDQKDDRKKNT
jgi:hypothetical protein